MELLELLSRSVFSLLILFTLTKLMGYRQISQLSYFDYIIGITIGSIAADMATGLEDDWWHTAVPMAVFAVLSIAVSFLTIKSIKMRRFVTGTPIILIEKGSILRKNLKKVHYDVNDLLAECRCAGYFNLSDIQWAVMEHTGKISFLPDVSKRPCTPEDLNLTPQPEGLMANLIMDGKIMKHHLEKIGKEEKWLQKQLSQQQIKDISKVILAIYDPLNDSFKVFEEGKEKKIFNVLE